MKQIYEIKSNPVRKTLAVFFSILLLIPALLIACSCMFGKFSEIIRDYFNACSDTYKGIDFYR